MGQGGVVNLIAQPLNAAQFAPYGEVIDLECAKQIPINEGLTTRFNDLVRADVAEEGGRICVNIFRSNPISLPHSVKYLERHPLGSQAFYPTAKTPFLVLVAPPAETVRAEDLQLFVSDGSLGVNLFKNTWHHYQMVLDQQSDFVVVDRAGPGNNLVEQDILGEAIITREVVIECLANMK